MLDRLKLAITRQLGWRNAGTGDRRSRGLLGGGDPPPLKP
jgi:hypothetical protein